MKFILLFTSAFCFAEFTSAQTIRLNFYNKDTLKINLVEEDMSVVYKNQPVSIKTIASLDSFMKKIPDPKNLEIVFETLNTKPETSHAVDNLLHKCNCHMTRKSRSMAKWD